MSETKNLCAMMEDDHAAASQSSKGEAYVKLSTTLESMDTGLREYFQEKTRKQMADVLAKLKDGQPITDEDVKQLKLWIVGDAQYYTKMENNFDDWRAELNRAVAAIKQLWDKDPDDETIMKLRGTLRDAIRTTADVLYYVQQKERVEKFNAATKEIDQSERLILVRLLEQKINSPHF